MSDYFTDLGKMLASQMARDPATRDRADAAIRRHLMAYDAMPKSLSPRYGARDQDPLGPRGVNYGNDPNDPNGGEVIDATEAEARLQAIFDALDPNQRPAMLLALAQFVEEHQGEADALDQVPINGIDRGMRNPAQDAALRRQDIAQRTRATNAFNARWGQLTNGIEIWSGVDKSRWPGG